MHIRDKLDLVRVMMSDEDTLKENIQEKKEELWDYFQASYIEFQKDIDSKIFNYLKREFKNASPLNNPSFEEEFTMGIPEFIFSSKDSAVRMRYVSFDDLKIVIKKRPTVPYLNKIKAELESFKEKAGIEKLIVHSLGNTLRFGYDTKE